MSVRRFAISLPFSVYSWSVPATLAWKDWFTAAFGPEGELWSCAGPKRDAITEAASADQKVVILYPTADSFILACLEAGQTPSEALKAWEASAQELTRVQRTRRSAIYLLPVPAMFNESSALAAHLAQWAGLTPPGDASGPGVAAPSAPPSPLLAVIATAAVLSSRNAQQLASRLSAAGYAMAPGANSIAMVDVAHALGCERMLLAQSLEQSRLEVAALRNLLKEQIVKVRRFEREERPALNREISARLDAIREMEARVVGDEQSLATLAEDRRRLEIDLHERGAEVEALLQSRSWRVTAPLRAARRSLSGTPRERQ